MATKMSRVVETAPKPKNVLKATSLKQQEGQTVREMIGRSVATKLWKPRVQKSVDSTQTDYKFWDELRHGKQVGYEFGSLFAIPIAEKVTSSVLGKELQVIHVDGDEYTNSQLTRFMTSSYGQIRSMLIDMYCLGDQYIVVNPDGSLSFPSPDTVEAEYDPLDYRRPIKYTIMTRLDKVEISDVYTAKNRIFKLKNITSEPVEFENGETLPPNKEIEHEYANLIGRIPIVHFTNDRRGNELFGRPIYEALLHLFGRYSDLLDKALDGAELMGNPIPVFEGMLDTEKTIDDNSNDTGETYQDIDGTIKERKQLDFETNSALVIGEGGTFKFASPAGGFTGDIRSMLKVLFLLMLEHIGIPETVWGGEMGQARATSSEQMAVFDEFVTGRRVALEGSVSTSEEETSPPVGGLLQLVDIWLRVRNLTDKKVKPGKVKIVWADLTQEDETMLVKKAEIAHNRDLITDETMLKQLKLPGIDEPGKEIKQAQDAKMGDRFNFDKAVDSDLHEPEPKVPEVEYEGVTA